MITKRVITSLDKISGEILEAVMKKYPGGWANHVQRISKPDGAFFHCITVDMEDTSYMIKVKVKVDTRSELEKEEEKALRMEEEQERESAQVEVEPSEEPEF